jgi:hypothetical protein
MWWYSKTRVESPDGLVVWIVWLSIDVDMSASPLMFESELSADIFLDLVAFQHPSNNQE